MNLRPVGDRGLLVELADNATAQQLARHVRDHFGDRVQEVVPGHTTVLIVGACRRPPAAELADWVPARQDTAREMEPLEVRVTYDGPDLAEVAAACGMSTDEVVRRHTAASYTVAFLGFAPGFAYVIGGDRGLRPGRRSQPRERVPAGAVALAGEYTAVYPRASPGGWQVIGSTELVMFDPAREPPALALPGRPIRFREATGD